MWGRLRCRCPSRWRTCRRSSIGTAAASTRHVCPAMQLEAAAAASRRPTSVVTPAPRVGQETEAPLAARATPLACSSAPDRDQSGQSGPLLRESEHDRRTRRGSDRHRIPDAVPQSGSVREWRAMTGKAHSIVGVDGNVGGAGRARCSPSSDCGRAHALRRPDEPVAEIVGEPILSLRSSRKQIERLNIGGRESSVIERAVL